MALDVEPVLERLSTLVKAAREWDKSRHRNPVSDALHDALELLTKPSPSADVIDVLRAVTKRFEHRCDEDNFMSDDDAEAIRDAYIVLGNA